MRGRTNFIGHKSLSSYYLGDDHQLLLSSHSSFSYSSLGSYKVSFPHTIRQQRDRERGGGGGSGCESFERDFYRTRNGGPNRSTSGEWGMDGH